MQGPASFAVLGVLAAATIALILAERTRAPAAMWGTKPVASAAFVLLSLPPADPWLFAAILLAFAGDLLLIPADPRIFRAGILAFLLAHVAFLAAFLARGIAWAYAGIALVVLSIIAILVARELLPRVDAILKRAVIAYMVVITLMVAGAAGAVAAGASPLILVAAIAFWANDLLVARDRFIAQKWMHRVVGLPLYYGAMAIFAIIASM